MRYTLGQAAKATGKSKPTIQRAIKSGSISAIKGDDGSYQIDPAELHRIFPSATDTGNAEQHMKRSVPPNYIDMLQLELKLLREEREREREQLTARIESLEQRLEESEKERREKDQRLMGLLTDQRQIFVASAPPSPSSAAEPVAQPDVRKRRWFGWGG